MRERTANATEMNACKTPAKTAAFVQMKSTVIAAHVLTALAAETVKATLTTAPQIPAITAAPAGTHSIVLFVTAHWDSTANVVRTTSMTAPITFAKMEPVWMGSMISLVCVILVMLDGCVIGRLICVTLILVSIVASVKKLILVIR